MVFILDPHTPVVMPPVHVSLRVRWGEQWIRSQGGQCRACRMVEEEEEEEGCVPLESEAASTRVGGPPSNQSAQNTQHTEPSITHSTVLQKCLP